MTSHIRNARILKGYSQEQMADLLGLSQSQYSRIESSGSGLDVKRIDSIARILELEVTEIVAGSRNDLPKIEQLLDRIYHLESEIRKVQIETRAALYEVNQLRKIMNEVFHSLNEKDYPAFKSRLSACGIIL
jgi:transcriptional regulator with XRE-family HTH domain